MCRLLAYVSRPEREVGSAVADVLPAFTAQSREHKDGWGLAWHRRDGIDVLRKPTTARDDPTYAPTLANTISDAAVVHLRRATPGIDVSDANTHPFLRDGIAFVHNGFVGPINELDVLAGPDLTPAGGTDSERYFLAVLALMRTRVGPAAALYATAHRMLTLAHTSGANAILLTDDALHVACAYKPGSQPQGSAEDYFALSYRVEEDSVVIASSGVARPDWTSLPNGAVLSVARGSLKTTVIDATQSASSVAR
jgi:predicted glutamine amidotransferase